MGRNSFAALEATDEGTVKELSGKLTRISSDFGSDLSNIEKLAKENLVDIALGAGSVRAAGAGNPHPLRQKTIGVSKGQGAPKNTLKKKPLMLLQPGLTTIGCRRICERRQAPCGPMLTSWKNFCWEQGKSSSQLSPITRKGPKRDRKVERPLSMS